MKLTKICNTLSVKRCLPLIFNLVMLALLFLMITQPVPASAQSTRKQVLFINSYHPGYKFSDDVTRAIAETFAKQGNIDLRIEYLDTKRVDSPEYLEEVKTLYQIKYKNANLDLIMSSDDAALNFLFKYANSLFPNVPVVFVGANFFDVNRLTGYERFTGISEEADIPGTLDVALKIHPNTRQVVAITDSTVTGQRIRQILEDVFPQYPQIKFELLQDVSMSELQQKVGGLPDDSLVLLTVFSRDKEGAFFEYDVYSSIIAESSSVPVYATWDFSLGYGVVGGKMTAGYTEGQRAANLAIRILNGEASQSIPVDKQSQAQYLFDYKAMQKWGINASQIPAGSIIINRPISFYEQYAAIIWSVAAGFVVLLFIIIFLAINNNQRRLAQRELARANRELQDFQATLEKRVEERTRALELAAEVSQRISSIRDQSVMVVEVVEQLKKTFNYYHAHIYLFDESRENLLMVGGTGEVGKTLLERGHKIPRGKGLVGRAAESGQPVLVPDTRADPAWLPNPLLPETRAEVAVPIVVGERVLGVLDAQNNQVGSLSELDVLLISTIADQVGIALENLRATQESQNLLADYQQLIETSPAAIAILDAQTGVFAQANPAMLELFELSPEDIGQTGPVLLSPEFQPDGRPSLEAAREKIEQAVRQGQNIFEWVHRTRTGREFRTEIRLTPAPSRAGRPMLNAIITDITARYEAEQQARRRAEREAILNRLTQAMQGTFSVEDALKLTARELGHVLGGKSVLIHLLPSDQHEV